MRILLIEDNVHISDLVKLGLEAELFTVDTCSDGVSGSYQARTNEYDLIILDIGLPKRRGPEVCRDIRAAGKKTPIIMLSVESDILTKVELLSIGADDYMTKPFSFEELLARARALLRRPHTQVPEKLSVDDLVLDSHTQEVERGKKKIYLTKKEFSLLEYLMRQDGRIVTRGSLLEHVWDLDGNPFSNSIETHICNLRKKINLPRRPRLIENVPGRGYRLAATAH